MSSKHRHALGRPAATAAICLTIAAAADARESADGAPPQRAAADDIHVFDPYMGRFQSRTFRDEEQRKDFHYVVEYEWFDAGKSIVKFKVSTVVPDDGKETLNAEGYYGYDPFNEQLYAFAAFAWGASGFGSVGEFDRETHRRVTWARSKAPDGAVIYVRDTFEIVDEDSWTNVTRVREGEDGDWKVVYEDTFRRVGG